MTDEIVVKHDPERQGYFVVVDPHNGVDPAAVYYRLATIPTEELERRNNERLVAFYRTQIANLTAALNRLEGKAQ